MSSNRKFAILSTSNKENLEWFASNLHQHGYTLVASGGTATTIRAANIPVVDVCETTRHPEMLNGRVKTLHPAIHSGILARNCSDDLESLSQFNYHLFDMVVCNLYPFVKTVTAGVQTVNDAIDQIDIGGVALLRAAAKNYQRVTVICDPTDYYRVSDEMSRCQAYQVTLKTRQELALKAFNHTAAYDLAIADYFRQEFKANVAQMNLRYGMNSHQREAQVFTSASCLPIQPMNGQPSFINMLDALNSWQLVQELQNITQLPAAASFKHVSPAGAAIAVPLSTAEIKSCMVEGFELSPLATAYTRARSADRLSSFGDWIALSDTCDIPTAKIIFAEVSDGVIAPGYDTTALELLKRKKKGKYVILRMDANYCPSAIEHRTVFGLKLQQERNQDIINYDTFSNITSQSTQLPTSAALDLLIATIAVKYAQSNSVCYSRFGQVIGLGAGQQSRIHCVRLAGDKAKLWWLRQHPYLLRSQFKNGVRRPEMNNAIDVYVRGTIGTDVSTASWKSYWEIEPQELTQCERDKWLSKLDEVSMSSDAFFPFRDSIDVASTIGVKYIAAPVGSMQDANVIAAADEKGIIFAKLANRLFHH